MCGINGIWYNSTSNPGVTVIQKMNQTLIHRGPDGEGTAELDNGKLFLGHRRLAIIDLTDAGKQPMSYMGKYTITYNGEIYNYIELRDDLQARGYRFQTATDTEVIMAAYDCWGVDCLSRFDGMFAFAIYNEEKHELFCARDRFGEKPFHYCQSDDFFAFSSEIKALWATGIQRSVDTYSMFLFLNMDLHEDPNDKSRTFFQKIKRLKPAHFLIVKGDQSVREYCYWSPDKISEITNLSFQEACKQFRKRFEQSVMRRMRSDVPFGTSLSGGLDSSAVALVMNRICSSDVEQKCFSARFNDSELDEGFFMKKVIENTDIQHLETYPDSNALISQIEKLMYHQEEPFGSASIFAQWEVFRLARNNQVIVLLDGQGADEVFAGYTHFFEPYLRQVFRQRGYRQAKQEYQTIKENNVITHDLELGWRFIAKSLFSNVYTDLHTLKRHLSGVSASREVHPELYNAYKNHMSPFKFFERLNDALAYYTTVSGLDKLLRFADRNSMAHSVEVRLPFLDHTLVEFAFSLPAHYKIHNGWTKALIRYGLADILPPEITWRKNKLGFQPPQKEWETTSEFTQYVNEVRNIAVHEKFVCTGAPNTWKVFVTGAFLKVHQSL